MLKNWSWFFLKRPPYSVIVFRIMQKINQLDSAIKLTEKELSRRIHKIESYQFVAIHTFYGE